MTNRAAGNKPGVRRGIRIWVQQLLSKYHCDFDLITKTEMKDITNTHSTRELIKYMLALYLELQKIFQKRKATKQSYY